ncbi:MAG TPA: hypothetical protein VF932_11625 [Anaerolineae bacterium]
MATTSRYPAIAVAIVNAGAVLALAPRTRIAARILAKLIVGGTCHLPQVRQGRLA